MVVRIVATVNVAIAVEDVEILVPQRAEKIVLVIAEIVVLKLVVETVQVVVEIVVV